MTMVENGPFPESGTYNQPRNVVPSEGDVLTHVETSFLEGKKGSRGQKYADNSLYNLYHKMVQ
jgi:hypothetical protein